MNNKQAYIIYNSAKKLFEAGKINEAINMLSKKAMYVRMWLYSDIFEKKGIRLCYNERLKKVYLSYIGNTFHKIAKGNCSFNYYTTTAEDIIENYDNIILEMLRNKPL